MAADVPVGGGSQQELRTPQTLTIDEIAAVLAKWIEPAPGVDAVYLFGSRVRGDNRPDSDVDVRVFVEQWQGDDATVNWWTEQNQSDFPALRAALPGPLELHRDSYLHDAADEAIVLGALSPALRVGRVFCVLTPPKL